MTRILEAGRDVSFSSTSNRGKHELIFVHSSWRTGSTWFWNKFRSIDDALCYYEPFNEDLENISFDKAQAAGYKSWDSGHPPSEPYYSSYLPFIDPTGGVQGFDLSFSLRWFIPAGGLRGQLRDKEVRYLKLLSEHAFRQNKRVVFGETRSLGRIWSIRESLGGYHIFVYRNLWNQWLSYLYYEHRSIQYFWESTARIVCQADDPFLKRIGDIFVDEALEIGRRRQATRNFTQNDKMLLLFSLPESSTFALFMIVHIYLYLHAELTADLSIDVTELARADDYRRQIEKQLAHEIGLGISLSDIIKPQRVGNVAIGSATIDWLRIRQHAEDAVRQLSGLGDSQHLRRLTSGLIEAASREMRRTEEEKLSGSRGDMSEELWYAGLKEARRHWQLGDNDGFLTRIFLVSKQRPHRAEPFFDLARFHRERSMYETASYFAEVGLALESPSHNENFVEDNVYQAGLREELSIAAFYSRDLARKGRGFAACNWLALNRTISDHSRTLARKHLRFYVLPARKLMSSFAAVELSCSDWELASASLADHGTEILILQCRKAGQSNETGGRARVLHIDKALKVFSSNEVQVPAELEAATLENMRLFVCGGTLQCLATLCADESLRKQQIFARIDRSNPRQYRFVDWRSFASEEPFWEDWIPLVTSGPRQKDRLLLMPAPFGMPDERVILMRLTDSLRVVSDTGNLIADRATLIRTEQFRGATQAIAFKGGWVTLVYEEVEGNPGEIFHHHRFVWFDESLELRAVSRPFYFQVHGKETATGLAWHPDGGRMVISYGEQDKLWLATFDAPQVQVALESVDRDRLPSGAS
jgi:hypothetical protein